MLNFQSNVFSTEDKMQILNDICPFIVSDIKFNLKYYEFYT